MMRARWLVLSISTLFGTFAIASCGDNKAAPTDAHLPQCSDTVDNDGDGMTDYPEDLGCTDPNDESEDSSAMPQCMDGRDNDGDGKIDFPNDPGCIVPQADDETDNCPSGAHCPECANGMDDDGNGMIDFPQDPGCSSAGDTDEFMHNAQACGTGMVIKPWPIINTDSGNLDPAVSTSMLMTTCGGGNGSPAVAYEIHISSPKVIVATTIGSTADTVLDLRKANCQADASELACNDDFQAADHSSKITKALGQGNYYLIVEGKTPAATGAYIVTVQFFNGVGDDCIDNSQCGPGLVCRIPLGGTTKKCEPHVCDDGVDDDGDGKLDYPTDPGCANPDDDDEADDCPNGPTCPACSNTLDDDGDGMTDYPADTSCSAASGNSESCNGEQDPILPVAGPTYTDTLVGAHDDHDPSCGSNGGVDRLFTLKVPNMRTITIDTDDSVVDTLLSLMNGSCAEPSLQCDDDSGATFHASLITRNNLAGGTYIVAVDAYSSTTTPDAFTLNVAGVIAPGGACNPSDTLGGALQCPSTNPCEGTTGNLRCRPSACGDGLDNDGDGKVDYPLDPGCTSTDDTTEDDTCPGAGCPECADTIDNDADGNIDYPADTQCLSASQASEACVTSDPVATITSGTTTGTTVGATNDFDPSCDSTTGGAPDVTYKLKLPSMRNLNVNLSPVSYDSVHVLLNSTCGNPSVACSDPPTMAVNTPLAAGNYYVVVDGWTATSTGTFTINVNGTIAPGGACNPADTLGGALQCPTTNPCMGSVGAMICQTSICNDGIDNDGDGKTDYPLDPGCTNLDDPSEADTCPGAGCPQCADGLDNDADGHIDYPADPQCLSASGTSETCSSTEPLNIITSAVTTGTTVGATNDFDPTCDSTAGGAPDVTYQLTTPHLTSLRLNLSPVSYDSVHMLLNSTCGGTPVQCSDPANMLISAGVNAGTYFVVVDGWTATSQGTFTLNVSGTIAVGGACNPSDTLNGAFTCPAANPCVGPAGSQVCQPAVCGDGMDNDGDGKIDYPLDPGCTSPDDTTEDDTCPGAGCPQCSDGMDNDGDGQTDYPNDTTCTSASGASELVCSADHDAGGQITMPMVTGDLTTATNELEPSCQTNDGNDVTYALVLPVPVASLVVDTEGSMVSDTVLTLRNATCSGATLGCDDDTGTGNLSRMTVTNLAAGTYMVTVDGFSTTNNGPFHLNTHGTVAAGTACTSALFTNGVLACPTGMSCTAGICQ